MPPPPTTLYKLKGNGQLLYISNVLGVQFSAPCHTQPSGAVGIAGLQGSSWNRVRKNIVNLRSPTSPAFGLPLDRLTNQCKCRRRPGPQLAFQRSRTTSRALNKCRCDRQETREGRLSAPHLPPGAAGCTPPRASAVCAGCSRRLRGVCSGAMGCTHSNCRGNGGPKV